MTKNHDITCLTLFSGRWHTMDAFFTGLDGIDYPKKKIHLLWCTNSDDKVFIDFLEREMAKRQKIYASVKLVIYAVRPSDWAFKDKGTGYQEHADLISNLYNNAFSYVKTEFVFSIEDDTVVPSHCIQRQFKTMLADPKCAVVVSMTFDRHNHGVLFVWDFKKAQTPRPDTGGYQIDYCLQEVRNTWGVKRVGAGGLGCTLLRMSILNTLGKPLFNERSPLSGVTGGCDIVLGMELNHRGYHVYADFDVRTLHIDSSGKVH